MSCRKNSGLISYRTVKKGMERQETSSERVNDRLGRVESLLEKRLIKLIKNQHLRFPKFEYGQGEEKKEYASKLVSKEEIIAAGDRRLGAFYLECLHLQRDSEYMKEVASEEYIAELSAIGSGNYR